MKTSLTSVLLAIALGLWVLRAQIPPRNPSVERHPVGTVSYLPYVDAKRILEDLPQSLVPAELRVQMPQLPDSAWAVWVSRRDAEIRSRVARGDEDSIINLLLFGTTFTNQ